MASRVHPTPAAISCLVQRAGQRAAGERRGIDPVDRRVAVQHGVEFRRRLTPGRPAFGLAAGEPVRGSPRRRRTGRPRRCATARRTARWCESPSATTDPPDRPVRDRTGWARWPAAGSTASTGTARLLPAGTIRPARAAKTAVDNWSAMPTWHSAPAAATASISRSARLLLGPEIAGRPAHRQHQKPGPQHLGARHQVVHRRDHPFEEAGVAVGVGGRDVQLRTTGRRFPSPQPSPHSRRTGGRRAGDHPVGQRDRDRGRRGQARGGRRGDRRPVHAPDRQHPGGHVESPGSRPADRPSSRAQPADPSRTLLIRPKPGRPLAVVS